METFVNIIGWVMAILTVVIPLPQMIKVCFRKDSEGINKITSCIYCFGVLCYTAFGSFTLGSTGEKLIYISVSNLLCGILYTVMVFFVFYYDKNISRKNLILATLFLLIVFAANIICFTIGIVRKDWYISNTVALVIIGASTGAFTTGAYIPQLLKTIRYKRVGSLSMTMIMLLITINVAYFIYYILLFNNSMIVPMVWTSLATCLYVILLSVCVRFRITNKKQAQTN
ncbi:PQ-loop repeat-containing protein [Mycoplasma phocoenae]|uniref:PQ-loop repeat-containing protein n=1 Tax=Mycoplasma phocoenae TaxID=754517 RepID=A0A858U6D7_9MOLU|nr:PQ-loop repeat-containing protein [Mycoplasma phocoenae]QJG66825.1 PQ-loop repeat-containing protein [Mycoplasma phocoenae]